MDTAANARFIHFKRSDKFYTEARGVCPREVFQPFLGHGDYASQVNTAMRILQANRGRMPGLSTTGSEFRTVIIPDEELDFGYPITLSPQED